MAKRRVGTGEPSLRIADFLALVHQGVSARLGDGMAGFDSRQRFGYVQYYRGDPGVHYEVWAQRKTGRVEVGLHFETADRDANYAALAQLADRIDDGDCEFRSATVFRATGIRNSVAQSEAAFDQLQLVAKPGKWRRGCDSGQPRIGGGE